jgi:long-chain acyl-CoA synthetase
MNPATLTIGRLLLEKVAKYPERPAIGWIENNEVRNLSFSEYKNQIEYLVFGLRKIGVTIGDKIAILAQTSKDWHLFDMATLCSRCTLVPVYPTYLAHEVEFIFNHSDAVALIVENDKQMEKIIPVLPNLTNLKYIISISELSEETIKKFRNSYPYFSMKELSRSGKEEVKARPDFFESNIKDQQPDEIASIMYTSGTTGEPKGAVITQDGLVSMLKNVEMTIKGAFTPNDKTLVFLPLSHVLGRTDSLLPLVFGWQAVYAESIEKLIDNLAIVKPTVMIAVPRIFEKIYSKIMEKTTCGTMIERQVFKWAVTVAEKYFQKIDLDLSPSASELLEYRLAKKLVFSKIYDRFGGRIRYFVSGGAPLAPDIIKFLRYANLTILEGYGLTETIAPVCLNPLAKQVPGTVGRPMGDVEISFAADGEILIKSRALMKEYYKNPDATKETMKDGWLFTGDIGEFTSEGFLKITDRKKDLIKTSGGKYVVPQKIENMAKMKPHISQFVVVGERRNFVTALVGIEKESFLHLLDEMNLPSDCSVSDLAKNAIVKEIVQNEINELNQELAQYETIKKFIIVSEEFTTDNFLTPSLKIKRKLVSEKYKDEIDKMYS